jgi:Lrp/AsnC family transcriptional regulator
LWQYLLNILEIEKKYSMDAKDRKILELLQQNALYTAAELADAVALTTTPCWRRVQKLEAQGYIRGRVALLDRELMNVGVTVFVSVRTGQHSRDWLERFIESVNNTPEIVEAYRLSGDTDYLLRIVVPSIQEYDRLYQRLIKELEFLDVSSSFAMEELKSTTAIPVSHA